MSLWPLLAAAGVGYLLLGKAKNGSAPTDTAERGSPQPLRAGVPYLFIVRLDKPEAEARPVLEGKGVQELVFSPASNPPFWVKSGPFSMAVASFKATPAGNSKVTLGEPFYGIGRLETLVRLDGQPFATPAPEA